MMHLYPALVCSFLDSGAVSILRGRKLRIFALSLTDRTSQQLLILFCLATYHHLLGIEFNTVTT